MGFAKTSSTRSRPAFVTLAHRIQEFSQRSKHSSEVWISGAWPVWTPLSLISNVIRMTGALRARSDPSKPWLQHLGTETALSLGMICRRSSWNLGTQSLSRGGSGKRPRTERVHRICVYDSYYRPF